MKIQAVHHNRHNQPIPYIRIVVDVHCHRQDLGLDLDLGPVQLDLPFNRRHFITTDHIKRCNSSSYAKNIITTKSVYRPIPVSNSIAGHQPIVRQNEIHFPGILNCRHRRRYHRNHRMMPIQTNNQRWKHASPINIIVERSRRRHCHHTPSSAAAAAVTNQIRKEEEEEERREKREEE